jgi:hypothetical protein
MHKESRIARYLIFFSSINRCVCRASSNEAREVKKEKKKTKNKTEEVELANKEIAWTTFWKIGVDLQLEGYI